MGRALLTAVLLIIAIMSNAQEVSSIGFVDSSWEEALLLAKKDKKAIFLYAFTPSCRYCRQMEKEVFTNLEVAKLYNSRFINYKINIDDGAEGEALAKEYAILGFPTYVFFSQNGELLHQSASAKPASEFILEQPLLYSMDVVANYNEPAAI